MLSICIPVFGYDARPLVRELLRQAEAVSESLEILVYDDHSEDRWRELNRELREMPRVRYTELPQNVGRAEIRNRMVRAAAGNRLLMLDVDSWPNPELLVRYLSAPPAAVLVGGTTYAEEPPENPDYLLHWRYGRHRETVAPARRRQGQYLQFQSNNFMAERDVLLTHPFPQVRGYGHEDTLWGQLLAPDGIEITYIDNPVDHLGLEPTEVFLEKQRQAIENLKQLRRSYPTLTTRLTRFADRYPVLSQVAEYIPERVLLRYLLRTRNLKALDVLKLKWWISAWVPAINYR
ncbi:glycosyltransferase involved in cell wall biosynthesis [Lewinella marina]|uniref:Glycosyl transferase n=1 Tax=Neolewinella marina TaxID=438751 RepID=A0A2G0CHF2_9BACT|nr:glycosyltransferase family 2 protein [Neolewinella marina]NJB86134.1 glycosyltransferase involved in cell wall biosynthesis [Neolewinella marina]PHK99388.1 glycosyl transferase [Neolewinella marina]